MNSNQLTTPLKEIISYITLRNQVFNLIKHFHEIIYSQFTLRFICVLCTLLTLFATIHKNGPRSCRVTGLMVKTFPSLLKATLSPAVTRELLFCHENHIGVPLPEHVNVTLSLNSTRFVLLTLADTPLTGSASKEKD